jgi:hypothetical protein
MRLKYYLAGLAGTCVAAYYFYVTGSKFTALSFSALAVGFMWAVSEETRSAWYSRRQDFE